MVICTVPASWSTDNSDASIGSKIKKDNADISKISAASKIKAVKKSKRTVKKKVVKKKTVKAKLKRYKVKVRYFYKGKWRTKYVYRYYSAPVYKAPAPAPAPLQIRDVPPWECTGPTANCQSDDPRIIAKMHELTTRKVTKPNPNPRPLEPMPVDSPDSEPQKSDFLDENGTLNATAYESAHTAWVNQNTAYNDYLAAKNVYDNYNDTITVEEKLTNYEKSVNIFNFARDVEYSFYFDTKRGAINTMNDRYGNCCDITHLLIALSRAAGIPARYINADCTFISGSRYGHIWAEVWFDGRWHTADASNDINDFEVIRNWNTGTMYLKGIFSSLPF